ncbi:MAG: AAA family ATPase [Deltaproteobacteria bacterium]|nr:AAA family ATPase [Deltaproteobacteria bacterium]
MTPQLPTLPVGWQLFEELRQKNAVYVDKTRYLPMLREAGDFVFCARPRRFGKTLTVHALDAYHSGREELFRGLAAEEHMSSPDFIARPVIRLDMSAVAGSRSIRILGKKIKGRLGVNAKRHEVHLTGADSAEAFVCLIEDVHSSSGNKVILLIDEYDAPIIKLIERERIVYDERLLAETRLVIREFYSQIKSAEEHIEFAFITGVTKFSRMGMFSLLNNLVDISVRPEFASFMGYTQEELETNFAPFLRNIAVKLGKSEKYLLDAIRDYYYGFSFDGKKMLYCPFSILSFLADAQSFISNGQFANYWMESGSNTLVRKFMKDKAFTFDQFQGYKVDLDFVRNPGEIDSTTPAGFLFQAGYLTLRVESGEAAESGEAFVLRYPNREVRSAVSALFLQNINPGWSDISQSGRDLRQHLANADVPGMVNVFTRVLDGIIHLDHADSNREPRAESVENAIIETAPDDFPEEMRWKLAGILTERLMREKGESFYRSILHACLWMAWAKVTPEKPESIGDLDLEATYGDKEYVIELKRRRMPRVPTRPSGRECARCSEKATVVAWTTQFWSRWSSAGRKGISLPAASRRTEARRTSRSGSRGRRSHLTLGVKSENSFP